MVYGPIHDCLFKKIAAGRAATSAQGGRLATVASRLVLRYADMQNLRQQVYWTDFLRLLWLKADRRKPHKVLRECGDSTVFDCGGRAPRTA